MTRHLLGVVAVVLAGSLTPDAQALEGQAQHVPKAILVDGFFSLLETEGEIDRRIVKHYLRTLQISQYSPVSRIFLEVADQYLLLKEQKRTDTEELVSRDGRLTERNQMERAKSHCERLGGLYGELLTRVSLLGISAEELDRRIDAQARASVRVFGLTDADLDAYDKAFESGLRRTTRIPVVGLKSRER